MPDDEVLQLARARLGRVLLGKYRLDRVLGVGGMAAVYLATHRNSKQFAVKMLHPELSLRDNIRTRFLREGYAANSVKHPGAVAVMDDDVADDGAAFLVMELLEGSPVDEICATYGRRMPLGLVLSIGDALLDVLAAAHARGIVHRDVKPPNLFLTHDGVLKVLDFGIARLLDEATGASTTVTGTMMGTPAFMAPEQALAKASEVDAQTDLWAVGATMFSLLSGTFVHTGDNAQQLLVSAATQRARSLASVTEGVPGPIAEVIARALAFDKADRWPKASTMREALQRACLEATGAPIAPLPRTDKPVTGLEETLAPASRASSSDIALAPTVDSGSESAPGSERSGVTTAGPVEKTDRDLTLRSPQGLWRKRGRAITAVLVCAVVAGGVAVYQASHAPRTRLCAFTVDSMDGARCGLVLDPDAAHARARRTARVTETGGHVSTVEWDNFMGFQVADELFTEEFIRDQNGGVREVKRRDHHGNMLRWEKWSERAKRIDLVDIDGTTPRTIDGTSISTIRREYDARGYVTRETYFGPTGKPRANADGAYGYVYVRGLAGRWTRRLVLAADGQPGATSAGLSLEVRSDDETPEGRSLQRFGVDGLPMTVDGVFESRIVLNDTFDVTEVQSFGIDREPAIDLKLGGHAQRLAWDPGKRVLETSVVGSGGQMRARKGDSYALDRRTFDERGRISMEEYLDTNGNRVRTRQGHAATRLTWDPHDDSVARESLDPDGALTLNHLDYARRVDAHDHRGNNIERRFFDEQGRPAAFRDGAAIQRLAYDSRGLRTTMASFDGDGKPVSDISGLHEMRTRFDRLRNAIENAAFGIDGRPTIDDEGIAIHRMTYDESDDLLEEEWFDETGAPLMRDGERAAERLTWDERGLEISHATLDSQHEPTLVRGYATVRYVRDRDGDIVDESYFGRRGEPTTCPEGYARRKMKYDVHRRRVETALVDAHEAPATGVEGWAIERIAFDDRGLVVREDHFDEAGKPVITTSGSASIARKWDERGNQIEETTLGTDGKALATRDGFATRRSAYDARDELIEEAFFDADGKPTSGRDGASIRRLRYDDLGNIVEESFLDGDHHPVSPTGTTYATVRHRFDPRQRLIETSWLDATGAPGKGPDGAAFVRYQRDAYGRPIETVYLDGALGPVASKDGKMVVRARYDEAGRLTEERFVDASGALRVASDRCAGHRLKYDAHGRKAEESCLDTKDGLALSTAGWAIQRTLYDGRGNPVDVARYGPDGALKPDPEGVARRRFSYDERNQLRETTCFDASDRPAHDKHGVHATRFAYDDAGKPVSTTYLDERGGTIAAPRE